MLYNAKRCVGRGGVTMRLAQLNKVLRPGTSYNLYSYQEQKFITVNKFMSFLTTIALLIYIYCEKHKLQPDIWSCAGN